MKINLILFASLLMSSLVFASCGESAKNPCNPCGGNPCNPCGGNPCGSAGSMSNASVQAKLKKYKKWKLTRTQKRGRRLWYSKSLGTNGQACMTCHVDGTWGLHLPNPKRYPHVVTMTSTSNKRNATKKWSLKGIINYCIVNPLKGKKIGKRSKKMKALIAYYKKMKKQSRK
ncbi:MAG: hypothetical protein IEMM0008_0574 [bacterium]|nr:MAG: hypothetical protein IEMM0008_0574 [bacterium]